MHGPIVKDVFGAARCMTKRVPTAALVHGPIVKDVIGAARCVIKSAPMAACVFIPIAKVGTAPCVSKTCSWRPR